MKVNKETIVKTTKKNWKYIATATAALVVGSTFGPSDADLAAVQDKYEQAQTKLEQTQDDLKLVSAEKDELSSKNKELSQKVDEAAPWFKLSEEEKKKTEAEAKAAEEKRLAEEKAKKEAEEKAKAEAEAKAKAEAEAREKQGYNTGITYDQLARTPDDYMFKKVKFRGKVIQVMEGDDTTQIRLAVNNDYDTILYGEYKPSVVNSRILEDDVITVYGTSAGIISYQSTMGGKISIPGVLITKIDQ